MRMEKAIITDSLWKKFIFWPIKWISKKEFKELYLSKLREKNDKIYRR